MQLPSSYCQRGFKWYLAQITTSVHKDSLNLRYSLHVNIFVGLTYLIPTRDCIDTVIEVHY